MRMFPSLLGFNLAKGFVQRSLAELRIVRSVCFRMYPVHHDVHVKVLRIRVSPEDVLVFVESQLLNGFLRSRLPLPSRWAFARLPAKLVVIDGIFHASVLICHATH